MQGIIMLNEHSEKTSQGIKTQTRRVVPQKTITKCNNDLDLILKESKYKVGDVLYIKEAYWLHINFDSFSPKQAYFNGADVVYFKECENAGTLRSPMYMPEYFSRQKIEITGVRVEGLNDISEEDCKLEGIEAYDYLKNDSGTLVPYYKLYVPKSEKAGNFAYFFGCVSNYIKHPNCEPFCDNISISPDIKTAYQTLFDSINGKGKYDTNPLVYVYEYAKYD